MGTPQLPLYERRIDVMKVKIAATEFEIKNTLPGVKNMMAHIDEAILESRGLLSHLLVDGVKITDDPLNYVKQNRKDIKEVEVILITEDQKLKSCPAKKAAKTISRSKTGPIRVTISNIVFELKRTLPNVKVMFSRIDEAMADFGVYFSHMVIDGVEVTSAPNEYVIENIKNIESIDVIFISHDEYLEQVTGIMVAFLVSAVPTIRAVADEFYGKPDDEAWSKFNACINGISSLLGIINSLVSSPELAGKTEAFAEVGSSIGLHLDNLLTAAKLNDYTLMADIMRFELVTFLEKLDTAVKELVGGHIDVVH